MTVMTRNGAEDVHAKEIAVDRTIEMAGIAKVVAIGNGTEATNDAKIDTMNANGTTGNMLAFIFGLSNEKKKH